MKMQSQTRRIAFTLAMLAFGIVIALLGNGCAIQKINKPPTWGSAIVTHARFYGLNASIPTGGGQDILKVQLGFGSETWTVIPVALQPTYAAKIADQFRLGQELSNFSTTIVEDMTSGFEGTPPPARHPRLFGPVENTNTVNKPLP